MIRWRSVTYLDRHRLSQVVALHNLLPFVVVNDSVNTVDERNVTPSEQTVLHKLQRHDEQQHNTSTCKRETVVCKANSKPLLSFCLESFAFSSTQYTQQ